MGPSNSEVTVLDGGFAYQMCRHVEDPVDGNPLWSAQHLFTEPQAVIETHLDFLRAGAELIMTNTYQASVNGFMEHLGLTEKQSYDLIKKAVELARTAIDIYIEEAGDTIVIKRPLIAGSVGPYGASLHDYSEYTGDYVDRVSGQEMIDWHRSRIKALVEAGVDILALETIPAQKEGEVLVELIKEFPQQKAWLSFSCKDDEHICHGERFQDAARICYDINPDQLVAVGVNCLNPKFVSPLLSGINKNRDDNIIPLIVYPNSGEIFDKQRGWIDGDRCDPVKTYVSDWLDLGVTYIGGCCRTYAKDVTQIKEEVRKWKSSQQVNGHS